MHVPVVVVRSSGPNEVEEVLEVGRQTNQCQRRHAVRRHREVSAGDVHEEVDVAAVPAPEVAALNEVQNLAGPHPKGQKSDATLKDGCCHGWRSLQEKLKPEACKPQR